MQTLTLPPRPAPDETPEPTEPPSPPPPPEPPTANPPTAGLPADGVDGAALAPGRQRELDGVLDMLRCPVRQRILFALAAGGPAHVGGLAARTAVGQKTLSHHLTHLRAAGLVLQTRRGRFVEYEAAADGRVRYDRGDDTGGRVSLTVTARGGEVAVTIALGRAQGLSAPPDAAERSGQPSGDCAA